MTQFIIANGRVVDGQGYELTVGPFTDREKTEKFAQLMAVSITENLAKVMGRPPAAVGTGGGDLVTDETREAMKKVAGVDAVPQYGSLGEFLEAFTGIKCECPNCVARRAADAEKADGSSPAAKH